MAFQSPTPAPDSIRAQMAERLQALVANGVVLSLAAQDAHWNLKGPTFGPLHELFGEVYSTVAGLVDRLAERAVTLGGVASGLAVLGSKEAVAAPASQDGLALCASLSDLVRAYVAQVEEGYRMAENLNLCADANALQDAVETLEKLGWKLAAHVA